MKKRASNPIEQRLIKTNKQGKWSTLIPIGGIVAYVVCFFMAKGRYAGGLEEYYMDKYLMCDIMEKVSKGGLVNPGRHIAVIGHILLFIGMTTFFYILPRLFNKSNLNTRIFQSFGILSMLLLLFVFTDYHDQLVLVAGIAGTISAIPLIYEYYNLELTFHKIFAVLCLFMSLLVFIGYQTRIGYTCLPVFQKSVYVLDSIWVFLVCRQIRLK